MNIHIHLQTLLWYLYAKRLISVTNSCITFNKRKYPAAPFSNLYVKRYKCIVTANSDRQSETSRFYPTHRHRIQLIISCDKLFAMFVYQIPPRSRHRRNNDSKSCSCNVTIESSLETSSRNCGWDNSVVNLRL